MASQWKVSDPLADEKIASVFRKCLAFSEPSQSSSLFLYFNAFNQEVDSSIKGDDGGVDAQDECLVEEAFHTQAARNTACSASWAAQVASFHTQRISVLRDQNE